MNFWEGINIIPGPRCISERNKGKPKEDCCYYWPDHHRSQPSYYDIWMRPFFKPLVNITFGLCSGSGIWMHSCDVLALVGKLIIWKALAFHRILLNRPYLLVPFVFNALPSNLGRRQTFEDCCLSKFNPNPNIFFTVLKGFLMLIHLASICHVPITL